MSKLSQFLVDSILNEAKSDVVTALFGGGFKPPTKGHLEVVLKAIQDNPEIDQVYIIVGSGVRNGISQEQSVKIWEKYKQFIPKTTEIIEAGSPMSWIKDYLKDHPEDKTYILIGAREGNEEDEKDVEQRSNLFQKYGGEIKPIYTVGGISGTKAREAAKQSKEAFYQFLPNQLSDSDKEEIYNIIIPTLNEVGEGSSKPYEWREDFGEYFFTTDNNVKYIVSLEEIPEGDKIGISVEFSAKTPGMQGYSSKIEVGKGELFRVMATIIDIIKSHLSKDPEIEFILYSPHKKSGEGDIGNQRDKLYKIFLQKQIPGIRIRDIGTSAVIAYLPQKSELNENASYSSDIDYKSLIKELTKYMIKDGWNILPLPKVVFKHGDSENARDFFGKTAYYNPNNQTIVLYTEGRHPKDIVRSFSHEMVHHEQNLDGRLGDIQTTNTQEDDYLNDIEAEANLNGTMTFRNWTDSLNENVLPQEKFAQEYGQDLVKKALSILPQKEKYNLKDYTVKILPIDKVKPTQFGEDYINASSEYEAEQYKKYIEGKIEVKDLRKEDFYPIIVDKDTMEILDGNHRHAVHTILGIPKIKAILVSKTNNNLNENQNSKATKVFVMKSPFTPKGWDFDHIGFVLDNGMLKDMSGHRYDKDQPMPPMTYKYEDTEELFQMPKDKNEAIKKGLYKEKSLPKPIEIPSNVACDIKDPNKKAINCGSFVKIVLSNSGIETTKSNKPGDIFKAIPTNTLAESGQKIAKKNMDDYKKSNNPSDKVSDPFGLSQYARELAQGLEEEILPQEKFAQETNQDYIEKALSILPQKEKYNLEDYTVKVLPLDKVKPTQFGEDYINASSEYEAEQYQKYIEGKIDIEDLRKEDFYPIVVDRDTMEILDGNHRHAVHTMLGIPKIKAILVSKKLNEAKKPYKHKHGLDDKLGKDPFGLNAYARELALGLEEEIEEGRKKKKDPKTGTGKKSVTIDMGPILKALKFKMPTGQETDENVIAVIDAAPQGTVPHPVFLDFYAKFDKYFGEENDSRMLDNFGLEYLLSKVLNLSNEDIQIVINHYNTTDQDSVEWFEQHDNELEKEEEWNVDGFDPTQDNLATVNQYLSKNKKLHESDPKKGTGKKPEGSGRRLYTDEDPKDTVGIKFRTKEDIVDTLNKKSFKAKSHARQSQIINLIHQRVRAAYQNAKDAETKARLKRGLDYIESRKEASKEKTKRLRKENLSENQNPQEKLEYYKNYYINLSPSIFDITTKNDNIVISGIDKNYPQNFNVENVRQVPINENVPSAKDDGKATPYGSGYEKVKEEMFQSSKIENQLKQKYSEVLEKLFLFEKGNYIELNLIKIKPEYKGQGWATKILDDLSEYAQENNKILTLTPSDTFGASKSRLEKFYKRFGFVPNKGKNKDFTTKDAMIRPLSEDTSELFTIYLDLDGVIADFDKRFKELAGMGPREYEDSFGTEKFWDFIDNKHGVKFWTGIEWMPEGKKLYNFIKQFDHKLLSAPSRNDASKTGKRIWAKKNTPGTQLILAAAVNKQNYADKSNILIDDREKNIQQWKDAGGIGILFKSTDQVIDELKKIMNL